MKSNYDEALRRLLVHEGGYSNHPDDPGGPTNYGITLEDYRKYINRNGNANDVRMMTVDQAKLIYRMHYADPLMFDYLPGGVDYAVFDYGVNSGISRSSKVLQRIVGADVDGEIGPETLKKTMARDPKVLVAAICDERLAFLQNLRTWPTFGKGWGRRVSEVRAAALVMAGKTQNVVPDTSSPSIIPGTVPPWFERMNAILGLYEYSGSKDNPAILEMAKACGGNIAKTYKHDSIAWCALTINYVLIASDFKGNDSLWALDFRKYGRSLTGPAVGAIASKTREGGGHVFLVVGRTGDGKIVGRGGNQSDMVCDELFNEGELRYNWPAEYPLPTKMTKDGLPIVQPRPKVKRDVVLPPPVGRTDGKAIVPPPKVGGKVSTGVGGSGAAAGYAWWDWVLAHPYETGMFAAGGAMLGGAVVYGARQWYKNNFEAMQTASTPGVTPVGVAA